jgi:hypothetical protein
MAPLRVGPAAVWIGDANAVATPVGAGVSARAATKGTMAAKVSTRSGTKKLRTVILKGMFRFLVDRVGFDCVTRG